MSVRIVAIGKKHETWIESGLERYQKRLKAPFNVEWVLLPHSSREGSDARQEESGRILATISAEDFVVLCDEKGKLLNSPAVSRILEDQFTHAKRVAIVIGGAYGVDASVHERADLVWSISPLVFPHQLVRLILIEQIYRFQGIACGHPYHHE